MNFNKVPYRGLWLSFQLPPKTKFNELPYRDSWKRELMDISVKEVERLMAEASEEIEEGNSIIAIGKVIQAMAGKIKLLEQRIEQLEQDAHTPFQNEL
jgi:hypothetical protein